MDGVQNNPTKFQRIIRYLPHKISIWWFEFRGGIKKRDCGWFEKRWEEERKKVKVITDAAEMLWVTLANVSDGDWTKQTKEWQKVAAKWRDNYHEAINTHNSNKEKK